MNNLKRIENAINYIENNIKKNTELKKIAKHACFSYYHFHRIFSAITGDTIGSYIRRRRLSLAADELINTKKQIIDIAFEYCFESHEAFSRSFKNLFGITPRQYRINKEKRIIKIKDKLTVTEIKHLNFLLTKNPEIVTIKRKKIIGIRGITSLNNNRIKDIWDSFIKQIGKIQNKINYPVTYGICENIPDYNLNDFTDDSEYYEFVGVETANYNNIPEGMDKKILKEGKYARFLHKGTVFDLTITYNYIWGTWILKTDRELDTRDDFEIYGKNFLGRSCKDSIIEIYIPIK